MGSVGKDFKCPLCGRKGHGGYAIDGVDCGPVCSERTALGSPSCMDKLDEAERSVCTGPQLLVGQAINALFARAPKLQLPPDTLELVALYLIPS